MSSKYEVDVNQFSQKLSEALSEISVLIQHFASEFGSSSPQAADCYLELRGFLIVQDQTSRQDLNPSTVSSQRGIHRFDDSLLIKYLLHDPSQREERLQEVESALAGSLDEWIRTDPQKVKKALSVLLDVAACWEIVGNTARSAVLTERVVDLCRDYLEPTDALTVSALIDTAAYCLKSGKPDEAESLLKEALEICEANPEAMGRYGPRVLMNLAAGPASRGQMPVAACYLDQALEVAEQASEPDKDHILEVLCNQAKVCTAMKQRERFDQIAARVLNEAKEYWKSDPDFATECMMTLFGLYQSQGRFDEARLISKTLGGLARR